MLITGTETVKEAVYNCSQCGRPFRKAATSESTICSSCERINNLMVLRNSRNDSIKKERI